LTLSYIKSTIKRIYFSALTLIVTYIQRLNKQQKKSLAAFLQTTPEVLRHYGKTKSASLERYSEIKKWAGENTPDDIPDLSELIKTYE